MSNKWTRAAIDAEERFKKRRGYNAVRAGTLTATTSSGFGRSTSSSSTVELEDPHPKDPQLTKLFRRLDRINQDPKKLPKGRIPHRVLAKLAAEIMDSLV